MSGDSTSRTNTGDSSQANTTAFGSLRGAISSSNACESPDGPFESVFVTVVDVMVHQSASVDVSDNDPGWRSVAPHLRDNPRQIDLLGDTSCFLALLGAQQLEAGHYQQIRIILKEDGYGLGGNRCPFNWANCVILQDGSPHLLELTSQHITGLRIPSGQIAGGALIVEAGQTMDFNITFDACRSVNILGDGRYQLQPTLTGGQAELNPDCPGANTN